MHEILEKALRQCSAAELFWVKKRSTPVEFENNRLKTIETSQQSGVALRVIKNGKIGFSSTTKVEDVDDLVANAIATAEFGAPAAFGFPGAGEFPKVENYDPKITDMTTADLVETGQRIVDTLIKEDPGILGRILIEKAQHESGIINSSGLNITHSATQYSVFALLDLIMGENFLNVYDGTGGAMASVDVDALTYRMVQKIRDGKRNASLPSGKYPVILTPLALQDLVRPFVACVNGRAVERGISPWKDKLASQVSDPRLRLYDDQTRRGAVGSSPFDDEGTPKSKLPIINDGVLENFLLDLHSANALKLRPTGSASRSSVESAPTIGTSTLVIDAGQIALSELQQQMKRGVIIDILMGAWSGNPYGGAVNGNILLGFVVEDGEIVGRIKNAMFSANAFEAFSSRIVAISKEQIDYGQSVYPYMLFDGIGIVTKD